MDVYGEPNKPKLYSYIRFSTDLQIKGDSMRRQLEQGKRYAEEHGLEIDEELKDLGLSAFRSEHAKRGALGEFLKLIEEGKITRESVLLLENLDRLSRDEMFDAVEIFMAIVRQGIKIVTLIDGREYTRKSRQADWFTLVAVLGRAHEESETKSIRLKAAWKAKRANIDAKKLTAICPMWLRFDRRTQGFKEIPDRCELIQRVFELYLKDGNGSEKIARILNSECIPAWKSSTGWHRSYVQKILHNRAVLGEFQPFVMDGKKRVPTGEPIKGYYPQIISEPVFHDTQERMARNANGGGGKTGKLNNLFPHLAKCGYCGAPMVFVDKGHGDQRYLICDNARRGRGCDKTSLRYTEFEEAFLRTCTELDVRAILPSNHEASDGEVSALVSKIYSARSELKRNSTQRKNLMNMLKDDDDEQFIKKMREELKQVITEGEALQKAIEETAATLETLRGAEKRAEEQLRGIAELLTILRDTTGDDLILIRQRVRTAIRQLVKRIEIFPNGLKGRIFSMSGLQPEYVDLRDTELGCEPDEYGEYLKETTGREHRRAGVWFVAGGFRELYYEGSRFNVGIQGESSIDVLDKILRGDR